MKKTVKEFVELLEFLRDENFSYKNLIEKLVSEDWDKCFLYQEKVIEHSRVQFIGLFSNGWFRKPVQVVVSTSAYRDNLYYCFIMIGEQLYQVAPVGGTSIEKE